MGLFSWLFRRASPPEHFEPSGDFTFEVVGESFYQDALLRICGGRTEHGHRKEVLTTLVHDDANPHDNMAIRVDVNGRTVGHLSRVAARQYRKWLAANNRAGKTMTCSALIVGGWDRGPEDRGHFGIKLDLPLLY